MTETIHVNKYDWYIQELKLSCYEGTATADTFEETITEIGLTEDVIICLLSYYGDDYKTQLIDFKVRGEQ